MTGFLDAMHNRPSSRGACAAGISKDASSLMQREMTASLPVIRLSIADASAPMAITL